MAKSVKSAGSARQTKSARARRGASSGKAGPPIKKKPARPDAPYHHGDLRGALLAAARVVLERDGVAGLTLRAAAREAGVSHAAPTHHFGDLTGLLSELAAVGFRDFDAAMQAAQATGTTPADRALARARAYLAYARSQPGMYQLMFRADRLDMNRPALRDASNASFASLARVVGIVHDGEVATDHLSITEAAQIARTWSLAHGFTMLALAGQLHDLLGRVPGRPDDETLFVEMLKITLPPRT
jgi:AcrR family transcriptional regulator